MQRGDLMYTNYDLMENIKEYNLILRDHRIDKYLFLVSQLTAMMIVFLCVDWVLGALCHAADPMPHEIGRLFFIRITNILIAYTMTNLIRYNGANTRRDPYEIIENHEKKITPIQRRKNIFFRYMESRNDFQSYLADGLYAMVLIILLVVHSKYRPPYGLSDPYWYHVTYNTLCIATVVVNRIAFFLLEREKRTDYNGVTLPVDITVRTAWIATVIVSSGIALWYIIK